MKGGGGVEGGGNGKREKEKGEEEEEERKRNADRKVYETGRDRGLWPSPRSRYELLRDTDGTAVAVRLPYLKRTESLGYTRS